MDTPEPEQKRKPKLREDMFVPYEPPHATPFPVGASITAYELIAFLPNTLRSADVIYRFVSNGATRRAIWSMVNTARDLQKEWRLQLCGLNLTKTMEDAGFEGWTFAAHDSWKLAQLVPWDDGNLDVSTFRTIAEVHGGGRPEEEIPFRDLALFVRDMPQGNDALNLTRMVQHCVDSPEEQWMYPQDFQKLLKKLGGPRPITQAHLDRAAFLRWDTKVPPPHRIWSIEDKQAAVDRMESRRKENKAKLDRARPPRSSVPKGQSPNRTPAPTPAPEASIATRVKKRGRPTNRAEYEMMDFEIESADGEDGEPAQEEEQSQTYKRPIASYVVPPEHGEAPSETAIVFAFRVEHEVGEDDIFSAYAFGGPRHQVPFRLLHDIKPPDESDIGGWAENLRWAHEQWNYFWDAIKNNGWNESPAHMDWISGIRQQQVWASDELVNHLSDE